MLYNIIKASNTAHFGLFFCMILEALQMNAIGIITIICPALIYKEKGSTMEMENSVVEFFVTTFLFVFVHLFLLSSNKLHSTS